MYTLNTTDNKVEELNTPYPIKVLKKVNLIPPRGKSAPSVLVERQVGGVTEKGIMPIDDFYSDPELSKQIGLVDADRKITKQDIINQLDKLCSDKNVITLVDKFGYCELNGAGVFVHAGGTITGMFSPKLPLTSSNLKLNFGHCNLMSLSPEDSAQELVSGFLSTFNISKSKPEIGTLLMAKIIGEALLHFKSSNVSMSFVNNGFKHTPSIAKLSKITYGEYVIDPFAIDSYSVKQKQKTHSKEMHNVYFNVEPEDIDRDVFSETYVLTSDTNFSKVMNLFIQYLVNNYDAIDSKVNSTFNKYEKKSSSKRHSTVGSIVADLMVGIHMFLNFCVEEKYLSKKKAKLICDSQFDIILSLIRNK